MAETLNFRKAAEQLHISQPPLSTQIRLLEEEIGAQLFERTPNGTFLTPAGVVFQLHASQILARVDAAIDDVRQAVEAKIGNLRIGWTVSADFNPFLPEAILQLRKRYPKVSVTLTKMLTSHQVDAVANGDIDIGIVRKPTQTLGDEFELKEIWRDRLVLAAGNDSEFAQRKTIRMEELKDQALIAYMSGPGIGINHVLKDMCRRRGFEPRIEQEASGTSTVLGLISAGLGIGLVPASLQIERVRGVTFVTVDADDAYCSIWSITRKTSTNPFIRRFLDLLDQTARQEKPALAQPEPQER